MLNPVNSQCLYQFLILYPDDCRLRWSLPPSALQIAFQRTFHGIRVKDLLLSKSLDDFYNESCSHHFFLHTFRCILMQRTSICFFLLFIFIENHLISLFADRKVLFLEQLLSQNGVGDVRGVLGAISLTHRLPFVEFGIESIENWSELSIISIRVVSIDWGDSNCKGQKSFRRKRWKVSIHYGHKHKYYFYHYFH